jgi:hypothetical protein
MIRHKEHAIALRPAEAANKLQFGYHLIMPKRRVRKRLFKTALFAQFSQITTYP